MSARPLPVRRHTVRQVDLLRQLVELMAAQGFAGLTLDDIAERLRCSKSTLYALAASKQELVVQVVREYFRGAVAVVEARIASVADPVLRVVEYLDAVAECLRPLSRAFMEDMSAFEPSASVYRRNTAAAADRIRELIGEGIAAQVFRPVHAAFVGEMVAATMFEIQRGEMFARLEITDSEAYAELASLVVHALAVDRESPAPDQRKH